MPHNIAQKQNMPILNGVPPYKEIKMDCEHTWKFIGKAPQGAEWQREDCVAPNMMWCTKAGCGELITIRCRSTVESVCAPCEAVYRSRVRTVVRLPLLVAKPGSTILLTLTAPGTQRHCVEHSYKGDDGKVRPSVRCYKGAVEEHAHTECPCSKNSFLYPGDLPLWNESLGRRWNDFMTDLRRSVPGFEDVQFFRALEPQERGALHVHAILRLKRVARMTDEINNLILQLAMHHGFGHEVDIRKIGSGSLDLVQAARYVAKYVSKTYGFSVPMPERKDCDCLPWDESQTAEKPDDFNHHGTPMWREKACDHPRVQKKLPFRIWTTSRRWGMSLSTVLIVQTCHSMNCAEQGRMISEQKLELVRQHQE